MLQGEKRIEKYQFSLKNLLGQGSYANVYLGKIIETGEKVAVKVIDKRLFANSYNVKNIQCEIEIMKKVDHPNIVKLYDVYQTTNNMYIITELCEEGDFYHLLQRKRKIQECQAKIYLKQIMKGIKYLHTNGIIHRDLKPANILMKNNQCKISDFGFAKNLQHDNTIMKSIVGTPLYMSPQLLKKLKYTNKSDLWSIGLIYYQMLHGRTPWPASNQLQLINGIYSKRPAFHSAIGTVSKDFINKCLQIQESKRMSWEDAFQHQLLANYKTIDNPSKIQFKYQRSVSPCYSSKSSLSTTYKQKKNTQNTSKTRVRLNQDLKSKQNKQNLNQNNSCIYAPSTKKGHFEQTQLKQVNISSMVSKNVSQRRLKRVQALTPKSTKGSSTIKTINSKLKQVMALTPRGQQQLKKKNGFSKSQITLNIK